MTVKLYHDVADPVLQWCHFIPVQNVQCEIAWENEQPESVYSNCTAVPLNDGSVVDTYVLKR